jgi:hypothetical protein
MRTVLKSFLLLAAFCCAASSLQAYNVVNPDGTINVGSDSLFTVLTSGDMNDYNNTFTGPSIIQGNVGIGGSGNFSMSDGTLYGDLYMNDTGTLSMSGPAVITGTKRGKKLNGISQNATLNSALNDAYALSTAAAGLAYTSNFNVTQGAFTQNQNINITNASQSITVNDPFGGSTIVLSIKDFVLSAGTFTLQGTAATTYIVNISGKFNINNATVIAAGGLLASHILYNLTGTQSAKGTATMQQGTSLTGMLLAAHRQVDLSGGKIYGRLVAEQLTLTSGGQVISQ